jgi:hypothetical protein
LEPEDYPVFKGGVRLTLYRDPVLRGGTRGFRATIPFGRLRVGPDRIELWVENASVPRWTASSLPLTLSREQICIFNKVGVISMGVGFRESGTLVHYFLTYRPAAVLTALEEFGYRTCP